MSFLIAGKFVPIPGVETIAPASHGGPKWAALDPGDGRQRIGKPSQIVLHTTKGIWPQRVNDDAGPRDLAKHVAQYWNRSEEHSAAQIVIGSDGVTACLCDLSYVAAHHATVSNQTSIGIEIYQHSDGGIYEAALEAAVIVTMYLCYHLSIPPIVLGATYSGAPLPQLLDGGKQYRAIYGHRSNTRRRGRGDPGDEIFSRLIDAGAEAMKADEYHATNRSRQAWLVEQGHKLVLDGIPGPATLQAAIAEGYVSWRDVPAMEVAP